MFDFVSMSSDMLTVYAATGPAADHVVPDGDAGEAAPGRGAVGSGPPARVPRHAVLRVRRRTRPSCGALYVQPQLSPTVRIPPLFYS